MYAIMQSKLIWIAIDNAAVGDNNRCLRQMVRVVRTSEHTGKSTVDKKEIEWKHRSEGDEQHRAIWKWWAEEDESWYGIQATHSIWHSSIALGRLLIMFTEIVLDSIRICSFALPLQCRFNYDLPLRTRHAS